MHYKVSALAVTSLRVTFPSRWTLIPINLKKKFVSNFFCSLCIAWFESKGYDLNNSVFMQLRTQIKTCYKLTFFAQMAY
jgi:hypothetical protein